MGRGTTFTGPLKIRKSDGSKVTIADEDGNIDAPLTPLNIPAATGLPSSVSGIYAPFVTVTVQQAISTATAVNLTSYFATIDSTSGALALTLADSTVLGQVKKVQMIVDGGEATLTFNTNATVVFADVGDTVELIWNGSDWIPVALYNIVDGATAPAYTPAS